MITRPGVFFVGRPFVVAGGLGGQGCPPYMVFQSVQSAILDRLPLQAHTAAKSLSIP